MQPAGTQDFMKLSLQDDACAASAGNQQACGLKHSHAVHRSLLLRWGVSEIVLLQVSGWTCQATRQMLSTASCSPMWTTALEL